MIRLLLSVLILSGCASTGTLDQSAMGPTRILDVLVLTDGSRTPDEISRALDETQVLLMPQVGIGFRVIASIPISWPSRNLEEMLGTVKMTAEASAIEYDLAIAFTRRTPVELLAYTLLVEWDGAIDDEERRYVITKTLSDRVLAHEVCHAFLRSREHSGTGLMGPVAIRLLPFTPELASRMLSTHDRAEIIRNKWMDLKGGTP